MGVDTGLDRAALNELMEDYGLAKPTIHNGVPFGAVGTTFVLETGRGRHLLRINRSKGELEVKRELDLLVFLRKHGFPCPQPLADRKGRWYRESGGTCIALYRWVDGVPLAPEKVTVARLEAVGRALAELHTVGKSYKKGIESRFSHERIAQLYGEVREQLPAYFRKIIRTLDDEVDYLAHYLEHKLPKGIIHGDVSCGALAFRGEKLVAILDFESACRGKFVFDLAAAVNALCCDASGYQIKRFEALIAGYESLRPLSLAEWDAFPNELRLAALRVVVHRLRALVAASPEEAGRADRAFREAYERLRILRREREGGMEALLMGMATGYDYRKYQRVKALEKKGSK